MIESVNWQICIIMSHVCRRGVGSKQDGICLFNGDEGVKKKNEGNDWVAGNRKLKLSLSIN